MPRIAFVAHFVICLAVAAVGFLAWQKGAIQWVYANDHTHVTLFVIALLVLGAIRLGWLAWNIGPETESDDGHFFIRICVLVAYAGTAGGLLWLLVDMETSGKPSFGAIATALCTAVTGGVAAFCLEVMTRSLEHGIAGEKRQ